LHEVGELNSVAFFRRVESDKSRLLVSVYDSLDNEVLVVVDEALPKFLKLTETTRSLIHQLDVLSATDLPLLRNALTFLKRSDFVIVHVAVVLASLSNEGFCALI